MSQSTPGNKLLFFIPTNMIVHVFWVLLSCLESSTANLKSCDEEHDHKNGGSVCTLVDFVEFLPPFDGENPVLLETELRLLDVHQINVDEKSISLYIELFSFWSDLGLSTFAGSEYVAIF